METEENLKYLTEKQDEDNYVYYYNKSKNLQSQYITSVDNIHLLNVRKVYTNDLYFGVYFSTLDNQRGILHHLKCKDRPWGVLETVEDESKFVPLVSKWIKGNKNRHDKKRTYIEQNFNIPYKVEYVYDEDLYAFSLIYVGNQMYRGFYNVPPSDESKILEYIDLGQKSHQNNVVTVSTSYSKIIIEHRSQYEKSWSDIKRRNSNGYV